ncbi:unnamed protein product [Bursaphelenchus okinawaensis]|uniref:BPTI/Kunitz inhibitor domain-containing protein n=1 Tax=Bursaphelenchus okinawaensis TaxID=465554 RepID=A0A811LLF5_9BILA|nr:unnamed protein product [Bursaphelenchus okinawaensis]CAG9125313.1 unnamed protein product [Bursaphelenchus okinawaensis]
MALKCITFTIIMCNIRCIEGKHSVSSLLDSVLSQLDPSVSTRYGVRQDLCPNGVDPQRNSDGNIKWCRLDAECRLNYECVPIVGLNHFGNPVKYCCPTKYSYCSRQPKIQDLINCAKPAITLYYFDTNRLKCRPYVVTGCDDVESTADEVQNRFGTIKDCRAKCETTACEIGETPLYLDDDFAKPFLCETRDACPHGYICRYDKLFRRQVCCGKTSFDPCPGYRTYIVPFTGRPRECDPLNREKDECPSDYLCTSTPQNALSYCCAHIPGVCPVGQRPCIHPLTANTIKCNPHSYDAACPSGYVCSPTIVGSSWGFCCSQTLVANCPRNTKPYINIATNMPQKCTVGVTTCNHGYVCQNSEPNAAMGFCCTPPHSAEIVVRPMSRLQTTTSRLTTPRLTTVASFVVQKSKSKSESAEEKKSSSENVDKSQEIETTSRASLEFSKEDKSTFEEAKVVSTLEQEVNSVTTTVKPTRTTTHTTTHRPKTVRNKNHKEDLKCPEDFNPMKYPKTGQIMHCTRSRKKDCPAPSKCLKARDDQFKRTLCCLHQDDQVNEDVSSNSESNEASKFKIIPDLNLGQSEDPTCPTIILSRSCRPGSVDDCEDNFFCQFNKQYKEYLCCSYLKNAGPNILYGPPSFVPFN